MYMVTELITNDVVGTTPELKIVYVTDSKLDAEKKLYEIKEYFKNTNWKASGRDYRVEDYNINSTKNNFRYVEVGSYTDESNILYEIQGQGFKKKINLDKLGGIIMDSAKVDSKINKCDDCVNYNGFPACCPRDITFGDGTGNDNIIKCRMYKKAKTGIIMGKVKESFMCSDCGASEEFLTEVTIDGNPVQLCDCCFADLIATGERASEDLLDLARDMRGGF